MSEFKQRYKITTPAGEVVYTEPGKNGPGDMRIFTIFPRIPWMTTLHYIGVVLRLKGIVEDRNYPQLKGYEGAWKLLKFIRDCITKRSVSIVQLCTDYEIPNGSRSLGKNNKCACGQMAAPNDKWCAVCRTALDNWEKY